MKLSQQEKSHLRESFRHMKPSEKADYIFTYYKPLLVALLILLVVLGSVVSRKLTHRDTLVCVAMVNVNVGPDLEKTLTEDFLDYSELPKRKNQVQLLTGLYLSENASAENHEFAYASRMKILASVNSQQLDLVLMNREAYDIFSNSDYLLDLDAAGVSDALTPYLTGNAVILEDNGLAVQLDESLEHTVVTENVTNALRVTDSPLFREAGFEQDVYIGVIANSQRQEAALAYLEYLMS